MLRFDEYDALRRRLPNASLPLDAIILRIYRPREPPVAIWWASTIASSLSYLHWRWCSHNFSSHLPHLCLFRRRIPSARLPRILFMPRISPMLRLCYEEAAMTPFRYLFPSAFEMAARMASASHGYLLLYASMTLFAVTRVRYWGAEMMHINWHSL